MSRLNVRVRNPFVSSTFAKVSSWLLVALGSLPDWGHAAALVPQGFVDEPYVGNIGRPTAMEFTPDGRLFVLEQTGRVRVISAGGVLQATPFATLNVDASGERGLLGITFDPAFARNQYVYLYYTVPGTPAHNRVSRFTANGNIAVPGSETVLLDLDDLSATATFHNGGTLQFGTDGKLYIAVGDNTNYANGQSLTTRLGKMLRINADGTIPADNPATFPGIAGSTSGLNRAIYAVGLRNPFKFAVQPTTGKWFINDVGENTWEEINAGGRGLNYGWSVSEGPTNNPDFKSPVFAYPHSGPAPSGCAITGGTFYDPPEGRHTVRGAGTDIGGASDSFQFVHQALSGDGSITARVATSNPTDPLAKVGVMIRAGLGAGAQHALMALTPDGGARLLSRAAQGGATSTVQGPSLTTPNWVRVTRSGNVFSGSVSPDGNTWTPVGAVTIPMGASVIAGLAVTSRDAQALNTAVFDHVTLSQGASSTDWESTDIGSPALAGSYNYVKSQFPDSYSGDYFFVDYCSGWIYTLDSQNPSNATSFASGLTYVVDLKAGPDGALYHFGYGISGVGRIRYTGKETQNILLSANSLDVNEGSAGIISVKLAKAPSGPVSVSIRRRMGPAPVTVSPATLNFNAANWNVPQEVAVSAPVDANTSDEGAKLVVSASGIAPQSVFVTSVDSGRPNGAPRAIIALAHSGDIVRGSNAEFFGNGYDDGTVVKAEFFVDGKLAYTDINNFGHYHIGGDHNLWNTTKLSDGAHRLMMKVYDAQGRAGTHRINVWVDNGVASSAHAPESAPAPD